MWTEMRLQFFVIFYELKLRLENKNKNKKYAVMSSHLVPHPIFSLTDTIS
jgi:hypothetical protein